MRSSAQRRAAHLALRRESGIVKMARKASKAEKAQRKLIENKQASTTKK